MKSFAIAAVLLAIAGCIQPSKLQITSRQLEGHDYLITSAGGIAHSATCKECTSSKTNSPSVYIKDGTLFIKSGN